MAEFQEALAVGKEAEVMVLNLIKKNINLHISLMDTLKNMIFSSPK